MEESRDRNKELNGKTYIEASRERLKNAKVLLDAGGYADSVSSIVIVQRVKDFTV